MNVFIPFNESSSLSVYREIERSIFDQIEIDVSITRVFCSLAKDSTLKWKPVAKQYCKQYMINCGDPYVVVNDWEYKNLLNTNYADMRRFLEVNTQYGAVSLYALTAPDPKYFHICIGIGMFRREALKVTRFDLYPSYCSCTSVMKSLYENGWKYGYIDQKPRCVKL
jgi:hypothetical protein